MRHRARLTDHDRVTVYGSQPHHLAFVASQRSSARRRMPRRTAIPRASSRCRVNWIVNAYGGSTTSAYRDESSFMGKLVPTDIQKGRQISVRAGRQHVSRSRRIPLVVQR